MRALYGGTHLVTTHLKLSLKLPLRQDELSMKDLYGSCRWRTSYNVVPSKGCPDRSTKHEYTSKRVALECPSLNPSGPQSGPIPLKLIKKTVFPHTSWGSMPPNPSTRNHKLEWPAATVKFVGRGSGAHGLDPLGSKKWKPPKMAPLLHWGT